MAIKLETRGLRMEYVRQRDGSRFVALDNVNIQIEDRKFVAVVGPSGCGKTTFIKIVDGLIKPTAGQILIDGRQVRGPGIDRAMVFQEPSLLPWRSVLDNVTYGLECQGRADSASRIRARELIKLVGLGNFESHYPHELSGGMQQRCNLARALAVDPEILIMDEPFAALDAQTRELMQDELLRVWRETRKTVLFVTHQINEAVYLADQVLVFGARPGSIREVVDIDLPRPRPLAIKRSSTFLEYEDRIWATIEREARQTMNEVALVSD
ncbi:ABC transporter ATP-binding protein [Rhodoplanes sp. Z2-YC6860]|uniref:ABC transporter ATP-binding protein n=1 Tax=Rhodoplanes sp. Z2-YC6860 TaxID=674703 RepID=UPI00078D20BE|nr:ABC transporter ATP-binding protein [Rhodoplanes sp. Z2-YC6860]AMN41499.1 nitrate ABC transporter ATPase [Rhodoplanes sp. Z2-YC6860]